MPGEVWSWPNQQVVRADESGPGTDTPPLFPPGESRWTFTTTTGQPSTDSGLVAIATSDQANPGTVWLTLKDQEGHDQTERAQKLVTGATLRIDNEAGGWQEYMCRTDPTIADGLVTLIDPVHWNAGAPLSDGDVVALTGYPPQAAQLPTGRGAEAAP